MRLLHDPLFATSRRLPDKVALVAGGAALRYGEIAREVERVAALFAEHGVEKGDRVLLFLPPCAEAVVALYAASLAGAAFVCVNPQVKAPKLRFLVEDVEPRAFVGFGPLAPVWRPALSGLAGLARTWVVRPGRDGVDAAAGEAPWPSGGAESSRAPSPSRGPGAIDADLATIIYTSGTTGEPKGVALTHTNMASALGSVLAYLPLDESDRILSTLPLAFSYGLYQVLLGFAVGATVYLEPTMSYPGKLLDLVQRERITVFPGVPTSFAMLLGLESLSSWDLGSLRILTNAAAALPEAHVRELLRRFPKARLYSMYGQTECKRISYLPPEELERRPTSVGRGMPNQEIYLVDEAGNRLPPGSTGELVVRGNHVMRGYWRRPEETAKKLRPGPFAGDVVLMTGDIFRMDEEGYLYFVGRRDDLIKTRGERVSPREVEEAIASLPEVAEVAVAGVPDPVLGQAVKAFVVARPGATLGADDVRRACAARLESFMVPKHVAFVDALPKTESGKVKRSALVS